MMEGTVESGSEDDLPDDDISILILELQESAYQSTFHQAARKGDLSMLNRMINSSRFSKEIPQEWLKKILLELLRKHQLESLYFLIHHCSEMFNNDLKYCLEFMEKSILTENFKIAQLFFDSFPERINLMNVYNFLEKSIPEDLALEIAKFIIPQNINLYRQQHRQANVVNTVEFAKRNGKNTLSRFIKQHIGYPKAVIQKLERIFDVIIDQAMQCAKTYPKPVLIVVGEHHGDYQSYQIEKALLKSAKNHNFKFFYHEKFGTHIQDVAKSKFNMILGMVDLHPQRGAETVERDVFIRQAVLPIKQPTLLIFGKSHLMGLLEDPHIVEKFYIVPFNLDLINSIRILENELTEFEAIYQYVKLSCEQRNKVEKDVTFAKDALTRAKFADDPNKAIQFLPDQMEFSDTTKVISHWNPLMIEENRLDEIFCTPSELRFINKKSSPVALSSDDEVVQSLRHFRGL